MGQWKRWEWREWQWCGDGGGQWRDVGGRSGGGVCGGGDGDRLDVSVRSRRRVGVGRGGFGF
jgi:hypothetical protein